ncbi:MAG: ATP-binding cassette domain-containing protein, partial [Alkalibacterium sp.]|nr:ATP-binding cassette domain-containing protein [Alkalibacterium sp.]
MNNSENKSLVYSIKDLNLWYGDTKALKNISIDIPEKEVIAIIGPSGCGKSTFIKTLNRMVELVPSVKTEGSIHYKKLDIKKAKVES